MKLYFLSKCKKHIKLILFPLLITIGISFTVPSLYAKTACTGIKVANCDFKAAYYSKKSGHTYGHQCTVNFSYYEKAGNQGKYKSWCKMMDHNVTLNN